MPDVMGYIFDDRRFKSGVHNLLTYSATPVAPETLDAYQLGIKTEIADHRVRLNAAAFYYNYKDIQLQEIATGAIMLVSAAAAEMKGIDVDFAFLPIDTLTVRGGFEIMSSHYTNFRNAPFFRPTLGPNGEPPGGTHRAGATRPVLMPSERPKKLRTSVLPIECRCQAGASTSSSAITTTADLRGIRSIVCVN
jgi:iron complex outermembrane receptor protein